MALTHARARALHLLPTLLCLAALLCAPALAQDPALRRPPSPPNPPPPPPSPPSPTPTPLPPSPTPSPTPLPPPPTPTPFNPDQCEPFALPGTECEAVVASSVAKNSFGVSQEFIWHEFLRLPISDVRMVPADCRRALVWYACNQGFPACNEQFAGGCVPDQASCLMVNDRCEPYGIVFNCTTAPPFIPGCNSTAALEATVAEPVPVLTCIDSKSAVNNTVPCCNHPFVLEGDTQECVVKCYVYAYSKSKENGLAIFAYTMVWINVVVVIIAFTPIFVVLNMRDFTTQVFPLIIITSICTQLTMTWSMYVGREEYLCDGIDSFEIAVYKFLTSDKCAVNVFFFTFFTIYNSYWIFVLAVLLLNRFRGSARDQPERLSLFWQLAIHLLGLAMAFSMAIVIITMAVDNHINSHGDWIIVYGIIEFHCHANPNSDAYYFQWMPRTILVGLGMLMIVFSFLLMILRNNLRLMLHFHWRTICTVIHMVIVQILIELMLYVVGDGWHKEIPDTAEAYAACVAGQPETATPDCHKQEVSAYWYLVLFFIVFYTSPTVLCIYVYFTNPLVITFWKRLVQERRVPTLSTATGSIRSTSKSKSKSNSSGSSQ